MELPFRSNEYSAGIKRLTEEKLREYVENPDNFHDEAVLAAIWEISKRRSLKKDEMDLEALISEKISTDIPMLNEGSEPELKELFSPLPSLYSIRSIQLFSVLFSVLAGGVLMAINFNRTSQKTEALKVLGFSFAYTIVSYLFILMLGVQSLIVTALLGLIGAYLIDELFWKRVLGNDFRFNTRQIWGALLFALILISPIVWYAVKTGMGDNL